MMAPYGAVVTRAIHEKHIYKEYIGVDACAVFLSHVFVDSSNDTQVPRGFRHSIQLRLGSISLVDAFDVSDSSSVDSFEDVQWGGVTAASAMNGDLQAYPPVHKALRDN